jgi:hypothetical protein
MLRVKIMAPTASRCIPLTLKIAYTLFVCILVPAYWAAYGPQNFLWGSDIALFFICAALWLEHPLPNSMMAIGLLPFEILWCLDFLSGARLIGSTAYMFDPGRPLLLNALSLFHIMLPVVILYLLCRLGYDRHALPAQTLLTWIVLPATYLLTDPTANINFAFGPGRHPQTLSPSLAYLGLLMLLLPMFVCLPMHLLLMRLCRRS